MSKITFPKKFLWSVAKISKYDDMIKTGLKTGIKYLIEFIAVMAIILTLAGTYIQSIEVKKIINYIDENVPKFKIENTAKEGEEANYKLSLENNEVIILDNQDFINIYKNIVVININIKEEEAVKEYYKLANDKNNCIILLENNCIIISPKYNPENENKEEGITRYTYLEILNNYIGKEVTEFDKTILMNSLYNIPYIQNMVSYFFNYFIVLLVVFVLDALLLSIIIKIIYKIIKKDINIKQSFSLSIYSLTLPTVVYIIYLILNYFAKFNISYFNSYIIMIAVIYVILYIYNIKKKEVA